MRQTPRQQAAAAFAVIDRHHDDQTSVVPMYAYTQLAEAMDALYGPLPNVDMLLAHPSKYDGDDRWSR